MTYYRHKCTISERYRPLLRSHARYATPSRTRMTPNHPSSVKCLISVKKGLLTVTTLLGLYHIDNSFIYNLQYTILSTNVFITSYTHTHTHTHNSYTHTQFFSFRDGYTLRNSHKENSLHTSFLYINIIF
jgi:hypothetical protein